MTVLSLSIYDPLLFKQILLATMHYESEDLEKRYMFNSTVSMVDEKGLN